MGASNLARSQKENFPVWKRVVLGLIGCAMLASLLGSQGAPKAQASQPVGDVIYNYPFNPAGSTTSLSDLAYTKVDHNAPANYYQGYEQAYTQAISAQYNGTATPDHLVISGNNISFFGYGIMPYMDYLFTADDPFMTASFGNAFTLIPENMNFHSFSESGYLFNGEMTQEGRSTYYTGYAIIFSCANAAGMQEDDTSAPNTASLCLYYINHELWNTENFKPGNTTNTRTLIMTMKTGIQNFDPTPYRISTEIDPNTRAFKVYLDGALLANVSASQVIGGATGPQGFGFYTGYYLHDCTILTRMRFEVVTVNTEPLNPTQTTAKVSFVDQSTGAEIRVPENETGYAPQQKYRIVQPLKITYDGDTYYLVSNSRTGTSRSDIQLRYQTDPSENETILYYVNAKGNTPESRELLAQPPEKNARVNGGDWSNGTTDTPVPVAAGDRIEYNVTAYSPPSAGVPMMMQGNSGASTDDTWWNQGAAVTPSYVTPVSVQKRQVSTITFVDLSAYFDPAGDVASQFLATYLVWNESVVLKAWDVTEPDTSVNPDYNGQHVVAWVTANSDTPGQYDLYIGGQGGVWMSASSAASYLFYYFSNVASVDLTCFHTDLAVNMSYMFGLFARDTTTPLTLDLTHFDTSRVTDMSYMFTSCCSSSIVPPTLDLTHFDTSQVTNMNHMFSSFGQLVQITPTTPLNLDLTHFDTSKVTDMSYMFYSFTQNTTAPPTLDLTHFDTSKVTDMSYMFSYFSQNTTAPPTLDLTHFNTSQVTNMSRMFISFANIAQITPTTPLTLDLTHFDTSRVTDMSYMFTSCCSSSIVPPTLDLTHFDTSQVTNMAAMFSGYAYSSTAPPTLNLSHFDTSQVTNMSQMFYSYAYSSTAPPTLDLTHFDTSQVTNMSQMFYNYAFSSTSPPTLDLTHFDTSQVTNMASMFANYAYSSTAPTTLDFTHFDTSRVTDMSNMFSNTRFATLDLRWAKIGAAPGGTNVGSMFRGCPQLIEVHLESGVFSAATITGSASMFGSRNANLKVYVGTPADQAWMIALGTTNGPAAGNVLVTTPWPPTDGTAWIAPTKIAPLPVTLIAPYPPVPIEGSGQSSSTNTTITDTIPDGLTIDTATITGIESSTAVDDAITWQVDGQQITWIVPNTMLPVDVYVTVTVNAGQVNGTDFDNTAYVGTEPTNTTYHRFKDAWRVTEQYFVYDNGPTTTQLDQDLTTLVSSEASYTVQGPLDSLSGYTYYGYQRIGLDSDITTGTPPDPAYDDGAVPVHGSDFGTTNQETIKLYYIRKAVTVTINFVDQTGSVIKTPVTVAAAANTDYYLLQSYFNSFTVGSSVYNYYDYMKNGDATVADVAPPVTPPARGAAPVYPDASVPTFPASMMGTDRNVTLCFTTDEIVTVHFVEDGNPSHVLHQDATYFVSGLFDPSTATRTDGSTQVPLDTDILSAETSRTYSYTSHYVLNGGSVQNGFPGTVTPPADIILYFSTRYSVTEKFHGVYDPETMTSAPVLAPDLPHPNLPGGHIFNPLDDPAGTAMPPAHIGGYYYVGYKLTNDSNPLIPGYPPAPLINGVWDDYIVIYVYDRQSSLDFSFTKLGEGNVPLGGVTFKLTPRNSEDSGWDSTEATLIASATDGAVTFAGLTDKTSYLLEETQTLPGYALPSGYWILSVDTSADPIFSFASQGSPMAFAYNTDTDTYSLTNYKVTHLPFSGSWGAVTFVVAGTVLLGLALLTLTTLRGKGRHARHNKKPKHSSA